MIGRGPIRQVTEPPRLGDRGEPAAGEKELLRQSSGFEGFGAIQKVLLPDYEAPSEREELKHRVAHGRAVPDPCPRC
jgi:hypothetical protein